MTLQPPKKHTVKRGPYGSRKRPKVTPLMSGRELAQTRTRAGLSQAELARRLGQLRQTIWHWENDKAPIPPDHYQQLLTVLTASKAEYDAMRASLLTTF